MAKSPKKALVTVGLLAKELSTVLPTSKRTKSILDGIFQALEVLRPHVETQNALPSSKATPKSRGR